MLRHVPVGCSPSRHFHHNVPKLPLSCEPLQYQNSLKFDRSLRPGSSTTSKKCDRHQLQSPLLAMAAPSASVQIANPADASPSSTLGKWWWLELVQQDVCWLTIFSVVASLCTCLKSVLVPFPFSLKEEGASNKSMYGGFTLLHHLAHFKSYKGLQGAGLKLPPNLLNQIVGSCTHLSNGKKRKFDYSNEPGLLSFGVSRSALVAWLQQSLQERHPDLKTYFEYELKSVDTFTNTASFRLRSNDFFSPKPASMEVKYELLVGADGVNSAVRSEMIQLDNAGTSSPKKKVKPLTLNFQASGETYKSFYVRPELAKRSPLFEDHNRVQTWPAINVLVTGMADGSFWGGTKSKQLMEASCAHEGNAPELFELLLEENPNFCEDFLRQPAISFGGAVTLSRFHHGNSLVIGDAAHAMLPSYGTGCNAALEDCPLLDQIFQEFIYGGEVINFEKVAMEFTKRRVEDAHAIVRMNTTQELFPRGFFSLLQVMLLTSLRKLAPKIFRPISYQQLWSDTPFRQIELQKRAEDMFFHGLLLILALLVIAALFFAYGVQPKLKFKPS